VVLTKNFCSCHAVSEKQPDPTARGFGEIFEKFQSFVQELSENSLFKYKIENKFFMEHQSLFTRKCPLTISSYCPFTDSRQKCVFSPGESLHGAPVQQRHLSIHIVFGLLSPNKSHELILILVSNLL
jgi:hypothetical protein